MQDKFPLIHQLQSEESVEFTKKAPTATNVKYKDFVVEVEGLQTLVKIPLREAEAFGRAIQKNKYIGRDTLRQLLRTHRGIRG